jgi:hypothetical protein
VLTHPAPQPQFVKHLGAYKLVKWTWHTDEDSDLAAESLIIRDPRGREVARIRDYRVFLTAVYRPKRGPTPILEITTWTGGAHASFRHLLYRLGRSPKCLLDFDEGNDLTGDYLARGLANFELTDLNGDGIPEILTWYDGFCYEVGAAYGIVIPTVLSLRNGCFMDSTIRFRRVLERELHAEQEGFSKDRAGNNPQSWFWQRPLPSTA